MGDCGGEPPAELDVEGDVEKVWTVTAVEVAVATTVLVGTVVAVLGLKTVTGVLVGAGVAVLNTFG